MKNRWMVWLVIAVTALIIFGCSSGNSPVIPPGQNIVVTGEGMPSDADSRYLWGYWTCYLDMESGTIEVVPAREIELHVNVLVFLQKGTPNLFIKNLIFDVDTVDVDVELRHPFPGMSQYTGFDVRGIFITGGSVSGYSDGGIIHSDKTETYLTNADGWTRWWNPNEFPVGNNIFSYVDGNLGNPYDGSNHNCTLNAFKYFCDDLDADSGLEELDFSHRGLFQSGYSNERHYTIHFDPIEGLVFNYAVDASWEIPDPDPPVAIPGDFPPDANAPEAYRIDPRIDDNTLFFEDAANKGGSATVEVDVYDWWGCDNTGLVAMRNYGGWTVSVTSASGGDENYSTYQFDFDGSLLESSDDLEMLLSAVSNDATYGLGDIDDENVSSYMFVTVPVSDSAMEPQVFSIDPDNEYIGETAEDVEVTGINFASNAEVTLADDATGGIEIEASGEVVTDGNLIVCDLDLSGGDVEPGQYDVIVTNPDTGLFGVLDKGFTVNDYAAPWPSWKCGDLNQAASEYVGYGDSTASGTPKWTFTAETQGHSGCAVANDGTIYFPTWNCALYAVNPDGSEKWKFQPQTPWISICPAIDDEGFVYTAMGSPSANYLYKINPDTGIQVWACYLDDTPCYATAPAIGHDGAVYVAYSTAYDSGYIQRVNPDGTPGWQYWIPSSSYSYNWQLGCAILPDGNIIAPGGTHGTILCFEPDGDIVWEYQYTNWILFTPSVGPEGNIYFTTWSGGDLVALDSDGEFLWSYDTGFYLWASPAVDPVTGNIFFGDRLGNFRCFENTGDVLWERSWASTGIDGSAAIDSNGDVYVAVGHQPGAPYRGLVKMDGDNGDILWQSDDLGYMLTASPSIGADGTVYMPGFSAEDALYAWGE